MDGQTLFSIFGFNSLNASTTFGIDCLNEASVDAAGALQTLDNLNTLCIK